MANWSAPGPSIARPILYATQRPGWHSRSLSLSLLSGACEIKGHAVQHYFDNLLPDNARIRARLGRRFKLKSIDTFNLLQALGRDCVGAVQLLPEGRSLEGWQDIDCEPCRTSRSPGSCKRCPPMPRRAARHRTTIFSAFRLQGPRRKPPSPMAKTMMSAAWQNPATHILKLPLALIGGSRRVDAADSVQNECLCAQIVGALGLPVARTSMATFDEQTVLMVERFDREWMDAGRWIARLPQEDFCHALGLAPDQKYEQHGCPGMLKCLQLLQGSQDKGHARLFLLSQLAFFLMAATDGHAKNFSIYLRRGDAYEMTPLYNVLSMWPYFVNSPSQFNQRKAALAMAIRSKNTHYLLHTMQARHWHQLAMKNGGPSVWQAMLALVARVDEALAAVEHRLPPNSRPARGRRSPSA